jgi:hypothetical protein
MDNQIYTQVRFNRTYNNIPYSDALYYDPAVFETKLQSDIDADIEARYQQWVAFILSPPLPEPEPDPTYTVTNEDGTVTDA